MTNSTTNPTTDDPAIIEQDIRRTQEDMSRTVDRLTNQLTFRNLFNALLDKADQNDVDARYLIEGARRNPIALGLIAAGAIWLVSDKDSKLPTLKSNKRGDRWDSGVDDYDVHHRDYVAHMSAVARSEGEDAVAYQHRRDMARANFLMVERSPEEDDHGFRQRLDSMTEKFREKRRAWADSTSQAGAGSRQKGRQAVSRAQDMYDSNPLVGGILAAAVGAALGSSLPVSRQEQEKLGDIGEKALDIANETKEQLTSQVREKKDELIEKADQKLRSAEPQPQSQGQVEPRYQPASASPAPSGGEPTPSDAPFILGDGTG